MRGGVNRPQLVDGDMGVDLGRRQVRVPEHGLDETDVRSVVQHMRRASVPEDVASAGKTDPCNVAADPVAQPVAAKRLPVVGEEELAAVQSLLETWPDLDQVAASRAGRECPSARPGPSRTSRRAR